MTLTDNDLAPGSECPVCDESIVTWFVKQVTNPDEFTLVSDNHCWVCADDVEPTGLNTGFAGNVIIIDHVGPSMETG